MFSHLRKRASAVKFGFSIKICNLFPWPSGGKACAVGWQRGKSKRGATEKKLPSEVPGQLGTSVEFNEVLQISATLYMDGGGKASPSGPFKKKCLILAILETDSNTKKPISLGRVVVNLADFAAVQTDVVREYPVACSKTIQAAVGDPKLVLTVRSSWKGASGPGSIASSLSSDATGATLTSQLSSLVRNRPPEQTYSRGMTGDQMDDLRVFDRLRTIKESESEHRLQVSSKTETEIGSTLGKTPNLAPAPSFDEDGFLMDSEDDLDKETGSTLETSKAGPNPSKSKMTNQINSWLDSSFDQESGNSQNGTGTIEKSNPSNPGQNTQEVQAQGSVTTIKVDKQETENGNVDPDGGLMQRKFAHRSNSSGDQVKMAKNEVLETLSDGPQALAQVISEKKTRLDETGKPPNEKFTRTQGPRRWRRVAQEEAGNQPEEETTVASSSPSAQEHIAGFSRSHEHPDMDIDMQAELRNVAFLEVSVYLVRAGRCQMKARTIHAPARRIIRTLVALGPERGGVLISDAVKAITAMIDGCGTDISGMAYWWSNCVHMRFLLANIASSGSRGAMPPSNGGQGLGEHSTMRETVDLLLQLEEHIFDRVQQYLWWKILVPGVARQGRTARGSHGCGKTDQEVVINRWLDVFQSLQDVFFLSPSGNGSDGHTLFLRQQVLQACCKRIDSLLFKELMAAQEIGSVIDDPFPVSLDDPSEALSLDDSVLPFKRGVITFGEGMRMKMAVTRWAEWAFEMNIKETQAGSKPGQNLFPKLKATADFLMMPKDLLSDASVRQDVFVALPTRCLCSLLRNFQPDDFAPDPLDSTLLQSLEATLRSCPDAPKAPSLAYCPPMPTAENGSAEEMLSFEFDDASDEEMENLGSLFGRKEMPARFRLLKELWLERSKRRYSR